MLTGVGSWSGVTSLSLRLDVGSKQQHDQLVWSAEWLRLSGLIKQLWALTSSLSGKANTGFHFRHQQSKLATHVAAITKKKKPVPAVRHIMHCDLSHSFVSHLISLLYLSCHIPPRAVEFLLFLLRNSALACGSPLCVTNYNIKQETVYISRLRYYCVVT